MFKHPDSKTVGPNFVESHIIEFEGVAPKLKDFYPQFRNQFRIKWAHLCSMSDLHSSFGLNMHGVHFHCPYFHGTYCLQMLPETSQPRFKTSVCQELGCSYLGISSFLLLKTIVDGCWGMEKSHSFGDMVLVHGPHPYTCGKHCLDSELINNNKTWGTGLLDRNVGLRELGGRRWWIWAKHTVYIYETFKEQIKILKIYSDLLLFLLPFLSLYISS